MNRYQDENWQQEEQRRREAYYRMNSQNSNTPDALEQIFRGPLNWMNLLMIGINVVIFIIMEFLGSTEDTGFMLQWGAACRPPILNGEWYRLFTSMFLHFGIEHLLNNMLVLFVLGSRLEQVIGKIKFLLIYLIGGVLGNVISLLIELRTQDFAVSAGASGAVFAVMGAMIYIVIRNKGWLGDLSMRQILVMAAFSLYFGFASTGVDNTAHVGGMVSGFFLAVIFIILEEKYKRKYLLSECFLHIVYPGGLQ